MGGLYWGCTFVHVQDLSDGRTGVVVYWYSHGRQPWGANVDPEPIRTAPPGLPCISRGASLEMERPPY